MLLVAGSASAVPIPVSGSGVINPATSITTRIYRDAAPSGCGGKAFPGTVAGTFGYAVEGPFGPATQDGCITITWSTSCTNYNIHPAAFRDGFDPAWGPSNAANYLGDPGASDIWTFSFPVTAGSRFVLVFENSFSPEACSYSYSFTYEGAAAGPVPGCDALIPIPATAVVGKFVAPAQVYWSPGKLTSPVVTVDAGKNYLVAGQDASGQYRKILIACDWVWVRAETVGPNPESPWNGAPLPTLVVD